MYIYKKKTVMKKEFKSMAMPCTDEHIKESLIKLGALDGDNGKYYFTNKYRSNIFVSIEESGLKVYVEKVYFHKVNTVNKLKKLIKLYL